MGINKSQQSVATGANRIAEILEKREEMGIRLDNSKPKPVEQNDFYKALSKNKTAVPSYQSVKTSQISMTKGFTT